MSNTRQASDLRDVGERRRRDAARQSGVEAGRARAEQVREQSTGQANRRALRAHLNAEAGIRFVQRLHTHTRTHSTRLNAGNTAMAAMHTVRRGRSNLGKGIERLAVGVPLRRQQDAPQPRPAPFAPSVVQQQLPHNKPDEAKLDTQQKHATREFKQQAKGGSDRVPEAAESMGSRRRAVHATLCKAPSQATPNHRAPLFQAKRHRWQAYG